MKPYFTVLKLFFLFSAIFIINVEGLQRCFMCRSRGELGSCKDDFNVNVTLVENKQEIGIETVPCASGWCGKIVESEDAAKEEYGVATQRICLQRGPSDSEDRCAYTKWNYKRVLMCFCRGDLCNSSTKLGINYILLTVPVIVGLLRLM
ncbi:UPAR/Ly6 domain-containing protein rtv-like [Diabrotica undecimpunctata]|uniref:UPAR/Ly6 domain-containing protein rtv-like n=1 Tax=Diabrotica undecimpunctata TaxID=50387 RepID=UPI003B6381AE